MARSQRDEPHRAAISDVASVDMDGADTINEVNIETQNATYTTAINAIITALEKEGITVTV